MTRALDWLRPTTSGPFTGQWGSTAETEALRLDGLVTELWPGAVRASDLAHGASGRAAAVADLVPSGGVLAYRSAVWVHTGQHRPDRLDVVLTAGRHRSNPFVCMHAERLPLADVVHVGGRAVTSQARTAVDVARRSALADAKDWLAALGSGLDASAVGAALDRAGGLRGAPRARALLTPLIQGARPLF